jgi:hypothetical protein
LFARVKAARKSTPDLNFTNIIIKSVFLQLLPLSVWLCNYLAKEYWRNGAKASHKMNAGEIDYVLGPML